MAAENDTGIIKLIVKAPNQLIIDQNIECNLSWTVLKLKEHLSQVYPSKPAVKEQKLIYSGQLLSDESYLKDFLRNYEGQKAHSLHLVCMPPRGAPDTWQRSTPAPRSPQPLSTTQQVPTATASQAPANADVSTSVPAHTSPTHVAHNQDTWAWLQTTQQQFMAASAQHPSMFTYPVTSVGQVYNPDSLAQMQQIYGQYMAQYLNQLQQAGVSNEVIGSMQMQAQHNWTMHQNRARGYPVANPAVPVGANPPNNVPAAPQIVGADDDDMRLGRQRDWLDWFYVLSRLFVLFSIVYFYSSLKRFVLVSVLGLVMYLYHLGFFRAQPANNGPEGEAPQQPGDQLDDDIIPEEVENQDNEQPDGGLRHRRPAENPPQVPDEPRAERVAPVQPHSIFVITWTFVTSFFASLIPERPNVV